MVKYFTLSQKQNTIDHKYCNQYYKSTYVSPGQTNNPGKHRRLTSMDSGLEAFSHNPTDGSFASLAGQLKANTNDPNQRFLSYWVELLSQQLMIHQ